MKVVGNLPVEGEEEINLGRSRLHSDLPRTFARNVWAAKSFAAAGVSGDNSKKLQVDHASDWKKAGIEVRGRGGRWDQKAKGIYRMLKILQPGVGTVKCGLIWGSAEDVEGVEDCLSCCGHLAHNSLELRKEWRRVKSQTPSPSSSLLFVDVDNAVGMI